MRQSSTVLFLVSLCAIAIGAYLIGVHGSDWTRMLRAQWAAAPDYPRITTLAGGPLVLISTSSCPWCAKTRDWLQQQGWPYRDCVLDQLPTANRILDAVATSAVPQLITPHGRVIGFDLDAYAALTGAVAPIRSHTEQTDDPWGCAQVGQVAGFSSLE